MTSGKCGDALAIGGADQIEPLVYTDINTLKRD